jgi:hypothetical protein
VSGEAPGTAVFRVAIGPAALRDATGDRALQRAMHEELLEDLMVHGQIVFASHDDMADFVAAVRSLPTSLAKAWETVLSSKRVAIVVADPERRPGVDDFLDAAQLDSAFSGALQLVLVESDQAELLGVAPDEFSALTPSGTVEVGRITTAGRTATILAAHRVMAAPLRAGLNREDEWRQRFGPLVAAASPTVIYDKYVGTQVARRYVHDRPLGDGLTWLLGRISMTPGRRVRIITAVPHTPDPREPVDEAALSLGFGRLKLSLGRPLGLELVLVPERTRDGGRVERFGHDRHIRFGQRAALALGMGIQSFADKRFRETIAVARLPVADAKEREERALKAALRPPPEGWLGWLNPPEAHT